MLWRLPEQGSDTAQAVWLSFQLETCRARRVGDGRECVFCAIGVGHRKVLSKEVHCRSLSSIHILYNHDPVQALYSLPGRCAQLAMFHWPEVVRYRGVGKTQDSPRSRNTLGIPRNTSTAATTRRQLRLPEPRSVADCRTHLASCVFLVPVPTLKLRAATEARRRC